MSAYRNNLMEQVKFLNRPASVVFVANTFVHNIGGNNVEPLQPGTSVDGVAIQGFDSSNPYFATAGLNMPVDGVAVTEDRWLIDVVGKASLGMVGDLFDIEAGGGANAGFVNVAAVTFTYGSLTGTFAVGEIVTVTSGPGVGSTYIVVTDNGTTSQTIQSVSVVGGGVQVGSVLLGGTSAAVATITVLSAPQPSQFKMEQFISATSCEFSVARNY
jgi:hypothetical protein